MTPVDIYFVGVLCQNFSICHNLIDSSISGRLISCDFFYCLQGNNHKRVVPSGTKAHWVNPYQFILAFWKEIISWESAQGSLSPIGLITSHFFTCYKAIISKESDQGALRPIGLIPSIFVTGFKAIISIE